MKIWVEFESEKVEEAITLEINGELRLDSVIALALSAAEKEGNPTDYQLTFKGKKWTAVDVEKSGGTIKDLGIQDADLLRLTRKHLLEQLKLSDNKLENLIRSIVVEKTMRKRLRQKHIAVAAKDLYQKMSDRRFHNSVSLQYPELAKVYDERKDDIGAFIIVYRHLFERQLKQNELIKDPTNKEGQKLIEQQILKQNLDKNLAKAAKLVPETFKPVPMLYIRVHLNGHEIIAFVDTGAQGSILSASVAEKCGLLRLVDKRFSITASGIGGARKALGKISACSMMINGNEVLCSLTVLDNKEIAVQLIIGLDILTANQSVIDLKNRSISFGSITTNFLSEEECKKHEVFTTNNNNTNSKLE